MGVGWGMDGPKSGFFLSALRSSAGLLCHHHGATSAHNDSPHFCGAGKVRSCQILQSRAELQSKTLRVLTLKEVRLLNTQLMIVEARHRSPNANVELVKKALVEKLAVSRLIKAES
jgi:hypothetical protein